MAQHSWESDASLLSDKPAGMDAKQAQLWHKGCSGIAAVVDAEVVHGQP